MDDLENVHISEKAVHGDGIRQLRKASENPVLDFSANLNPFPPETGWVPNPASLRDYPDDTYTELRESFARSVGRQSDEITVGNGSVEIIRTFCNTIVKDGTKVFIPHPVFAEYELSVKLAGGTLVTDPSDANLRFLCNPNNPTGHFLKREEVTTILEDCEDAGQMLFLDEAFIDLSDPAESLCGNSSENLFIIRSLTKSFAVPGLRIGFGIGNSDLITRLEVNRPPWTINAFAESFALAAIKKFDALVPVRERLKMEREWICQNLSECGLNYLPPGANFILVKLPCTATTFTNKLLDEGIFVRDCTSFGLPNNIRIAVRSHEENEQLIQAVRRCLH